MLVDRESCTMDDAWLLLEETGVAISYIRLETIKASSI